MSKYIVDSSLMTGIANNIRLKTGKQENLVFPSGFNTAIESLPSIEDITEIKEKINDVKDIFNNMDFKINGEIINSDIVTVDDAVADAVKEMRIEIAPVQDLHGYDSPWPAGGNVNKLDVDLPITLAEAGNIGQKPCVLPPGTYTFTSKTSASAAYSLTVFNSQNTQIAIINSAIASSSALSVNFTIEEASAYIKCYYNAAVTVTDMQIEPGTSFSGFVPYSNICPISGWTGCNVNRTGKNLFDKSKYSFRNRRTNTNNGSTYTANGYSVSEFIPVIPGYAYTLTSTISSYIAWYSENNSGFISGRAWANKTSLTAPENAHYLRFDYPTDAEDQVLLELGSTASAYEPYQGSTYSITFPSSAGTVYGGTLTINRDGTGKLVVDRAEVDLGTLSYTKYDVAQGTLFRGPISGVKTLSSVAVPNMICSMYPVTDSSRRSNKTVSQATGLAVVDVIDNDYTDSTTFKTAMSGIQLVYELATPVTYELSSQQVVQLLNGFNNVWADTGDILSMTYSKMPTESINTPSNIINFNNGAYDAPMKLKVAVEPVQDLHGYDSPWPEGGSKNLFDYDTAYGAFKVADNSFSGDTSTIAGVKNYVPSDLVGKMLTFSAYLDLTGQSGPTSYRPIASVDGAVVTGTYISPGTASYVSVTFTPVSSDDYFEFTWGSGNGAVKIKNIMLEVSQSKTDWVPYSNICPISGWTGCNVTRTGQNLVNPATIKSGYYIRAENVSESKPLGSENALAGFSCSDYIPVKPLTEYTQSLPGFRGAAAAGLVFFSSKSVEGAISGVSLSTQGGKTYNFTTPSNCNYIRTSWEDITPTGNYPLPQVEKGIQTEYKPYSGTTTYPITFPSSAGTVYGGELTINQDGSGTLVVDRAKITFDGTQTVGLANWRVNSNSVGWLYARSLTPDIKQAPSTDDAPNIISDVLKTVKYGGSEGIYGCSIDCISSVWNSNDWGIAMRSTDTSLTTASAINAWLAQNPVIAVYELANPVTYELSNLEVIETLKGINNIWADTGKINEVEYSADSQLYITNKFNELDSLLSTYTETQA